MSGILNAIKTAGLAAGIVFAGVIGMGPVTEQSVSAQTSLPHHSEVRLLAGKQEGSTWSAGLEINLAPGWKTYWRVPGEAGIPPSVMFDGSDNLADVKMDWPVPSRLQDYSGEAIGYKGRVIFPLTVKPQDPSKPVSIKLALFYAVCNDICIPARSELSATLSQEVGSKLNQVLISSYSKKVPSETARPETVVSDLRVANREDKSILSFSVSGAQNPNELDVFIEGYEFAYFNKPAYLGGSTAEQPARYEVIVNGLKDAGELRGKELQMTFVEGDQSFVRRLSVQ